MGIERRSDTNTPKQSDKLDIFSDTIKLEEKNTLDPLKQDLSELKNQVQINPKPPTKGKPLSDIDNGVINVKTQTDMNSTTKDLGDGEIAKPVLIGSEITIMNTSDNGKRLPSRGQRGRMRQISDHWGVSVSSTNLQGIRLGKGARKNQQPNEVSSSSAPSKPIMKEIYNEELLDAYDENIETIDDLNNDQALKEEINRMKGEEDVNKEVTMQDYEKYLGILAMVRTTERLQDSDELTKEALEQTLHEQGITISSEFLSDFIDHVKLTAHGQRFDPAEANLDHLGDVPGLDEAYKEYAKTNLHLPSYEQVRVIRNTSPITILEDLQEQGVSINDYIQDTKTTFEELMTYQKKKMNDNSGDFIKNGRLENALNAAQKSRKITEVSKLTNSLYVNEFAKPIEHVQGMIAGSSDTADLKHVSFENNHRFNLEIQDSFLPNNQKKASLDLQDADDVFHIQNNIETQYLTDSGYLLRMKKSVKKDDPESLQLAFQQQVFLGNVLGVLGIDETTGITDLQKESLATFTHLGSSLSVSQLKTINQKINNPDFALAMLHSNLDPLDDPAAGSKSDQIARNLTSFVRRRVLGRNATERGRIDESFDSQVIFTAFDLFDDLTHSPDAGVHEEDELILKKKFPEYELKKLEHSSVCYLV